MSKVIKAIIIDDEAGSRELISSLLKLGNSPVQVVDTADSVASGHAAVLKHEPDLVFLDVEMQDGTGFDLLNRFDRISFKIIFITAHQQFAINAFRYSAIDYLPKPLSPVNFMNALEKAEKHIAEEDLEVQMKALLHNVNGGEKQKKKLVLKTLDKIYAVYTSDIIRLEAEGSYTHVHLAAGKKIMVSRGIKDFESLLEDAGFARVHQSHLINTGYIFCFEKSGHYLVMKDDSVVPVATRKKDLVLHLIQEG